MKILLISCTVAFVFFFLIYVEMKRNKAALEAMPVPVWIERYEVDEILREQANAVRVLGTGSMRPTIPAGLLRLPFTSQDPWIH
jgi:hypothetical protein